MRQQLGLTYQELIELGSHYQRRREHSLPLGAVVQSLLEKGYLRRSTRIGDDVIPPDSKTEKPTVILTMSPAAKMRWESVPATERSFFQFSPY